MLRILSTRSGCAVRNANALDMASVKMGIKRSLKRSMTSRRSLNQSLLPLQQHSGLVVVDSSKLSNNFGATIRDPSTKRITTTQQHFFDHSTSTMSKNLCRRQRHQLAATVSSSMSPFPLLSAVEQSDSFNIDDDIMLVEQRRQVMKLFLNTLHANLNLAIKPSESSPSRHIPLNLEVKHAISTREIGEEEQHILENEELSSTSKKDSFAISSKRQYSYKEQLLHNLNRNIWKNRVNNSLSLFKDAQKNGLVLPAKITSDLFFMLSEKDPIKAYKVLQYYNQHHSHLHSNGIWIPMYKRMCTAIRKLDPKCYFHTPKQINNCVESLLAEIDEMNTETKQMLYPILVVSFATQGNVALGLYAGDIYRAMVDQNFEIKIGWLSRLLALSKYNRQEDLPFAEVFERLVDMGGTPNPPTFLPAIQNMFPFTDTEQMCIFLKSWLKLETSKRNNASVVNEHDERQPWHTNYFIDLSTLEDISSGAARVGDTTLALLIWDVLEFCSYRPTEALYENTISAFASLQRDGIPKALAVMAAMQEDGYTPSLPLIRSFSLAIRHNKRTVDCALHTLLDDHEEAQLGSNNRKSLLSLESLNTVMSCYAERGDTEEALNILDIMDENNIQPNEDSYSFALEVLGKNIRRRSRPINPSDVHRYVDLSDEILSRMEQSNIHPSRHVVRNYVELLCLAGEVETANLVLENCLTYSDSRSVLCNKVIYRVALANADKGKFEKAKELAGLMTQEMTMLDKIIRSKEQRSLHLEEIEQVPSGDTHSSD